MFESTIEIRSRDIESPAQIPGDPQHLFIIHTASNGERFIIRGGPEIDGLKSMMVDNLNIIKAPYLKEFERLFPNDYKDYAPSILIAKGSDIDMQSYIDKMWNIAEKINAANFDYKLPIPGCTPDLCHVQNSNTIVKILVEKAGLEFKLPEVNGVKVWAPGVDGSLKHTDFDRKVSFWIDKIDSKLSPGVGQCKSKFDLEFLTDEPTT
ncbi:MAG: hypothetical protein AABY27_05070, partial [Pseudomonadota bacterium]